LGIANADAPLGHPVVGSSFEGLVIENVVAACAPSLCHVLLLWSEAHEVR
jgi:hypothetical protein